MRIERADGSIYDTEQTRDSRGRFVKVEAKPGAKVSTLEEMGFGELAAMIDGDDRELKECLGNPEEEMRELRRSFGLE